MFASDIFLAEEAEVQARNQKEITSQNAVATAEGLLLPMYSSDSRAASRHARSQEHPWPNAKSSPREQTITAGYMMRPPENPHYNNPPLSYTSGSLPPPRPLRMPPSARNASQHQSPQLRSAHPDQRMPPVDYHPPPFAAPNSYPPPPQDPFAQDPYSQQPPQDPYSQQPPQDPFAQPPQDPFLQQPPQDPFLQQPPQDPFAQPPQDPFVQQPREPFPREPFMQPPRGSYGQASQEPFAQPPVSPFAPAQHNGEEGVPQEDPFGGQASIPPSYAVQGQQESQPPPLRQPPPAMYQPHSAEQEEIQLMHPNETEPMRALPSQQAHLSDSLPPMQLHEEGLVQMRDAGDTHSLHSRSSYRQPAEYGEAPQSQPNSQLENPPTYATDSFYNPHAAIDNRNEGDGSLLSHGISPRHQSNDQPPGPHGADDFQPPFVAFTLSGKDGPSDPQFNAAAPTDHSMQANPAFSGSEMPTGRSPFTQPLADNVTPSTEQPTDHSPAPNSEVANAEEADKRKHLVRLTDMLKSAQQVSEVEKRNRELINSLKDALERSQAESDRGVVATLSECMNSLEAYEEARKTRLNRQIELGKVFERIYAKKIGNKAKITQLILDTNKLVESLKNQSQAEAAQFHLSGAHPQGMSSSVEPELCS